MVDLGVFLPVISGGWVVSTAVPQGVVYIGITPIIASVEGCDPYANAGRIVLPLVHKHFLVQRHRLGKVLVQTGATTMVGTMIGNVEAYNLVSPEALANPHPIYDELRRESPVHWSEELRAWILSRYDDVMAALHDPRLSSDRIQQFATHQLRDLDVSIVADFLRIVQRMIALQDMPQHTRLRKMASESFTRRALEDFRPAVQQVADVLLDRVQPYQRMDLVTDVAQPLPATVIAEMFGIPSDDREHFQRWADDVIRFFGGPFGNVEEDARRANAGAVNLECYFLHLMAQCRCEPGHDLMSLLLTHQEQGLWDEQDLSAQCVMILVGGHVTTIDQLCNGAHALLKHPDQLQKLRQ